MTDRLLVSVITPTIPARFDLLLGTMRDIADQSYPNLEHVICIEGQPSAVDDAVTRVKLEARAQPRSITTRVVGLGRHWTVELSGSYATAPIMVGQFLARGEYSCIWSDDERAMDSDHITKMVDLIESSGADFVYPIVEVWRKDEPDFRRLIWADPPVDGSITHWMYRVSMIEKAKGPYRTHIGRLGNDWDFISRAMAGGATWAMLPEITFEHRIDS